MSKVKLKHASGNSMSIAAPATNPASDLELKLPATIGTAGQALVNSSTAGTLEFSGSARRVLEEFGSPCDGSVIATANGNVTFPNVTAAQTTTTSWTDVTGSNITYNPPTGATQVIYEFNYLSASVDSTLLGSWKLFLDSDEVTKARQQHRSNYYEGCQVFKWIFNIGGSADTTVGRVASWSSNKTIKLQLVDYTASYDYKIHETSYWDGGTTDELSIPTLHIKAIG